MYVCICIDIYMYIYVYICIDIKHFLVALSFEESAVSQTELIQTDKVQANTTGRLYAEMV
jgi:hypothetical protein